MTLDSYFQISERGSTVKREILAGITTFITMAYILAVNPSIISATGIPATSAFTATVLASFIACMIMGWFANIPIALAPAMGINAFFAYVVCIKMGYPYQLALTAVFCEGVFFMLMSLFNVREAIVKAIPFSLRSGIAAGIGLFISFIGLQSANIVVSDPATLISVGHLTDPKPLTGIIGLILCIFLYTKKVKGCFLITIFVTTAIGFITGITVIPDHFTLASIPEKPLFFDFQWNKIFSLDFFVVFFTFLFIDVFDTIGTFIAVISQAGLMDKNGDIPRIKQAFLADASGTLFGSILGTSTVSSYVESTAGIAEGGRTGLTAVCTGLCFAAALFLSPLFLLVPTAATAPVLIFVGFLMIKEINKIDLSRADIGIPAFFAMIIMPFTYSVGEGIVFGVLAQTFCLLAAKKAKEISPLLWALSAIFIVWIIIR